MDDTTPNDSFEEQRDPFALFDTWMTDARTSSNPEPSAMTLSTVGHDGRPSSRLVLLKAHDRTGFVFYTNLGSKKSLDIEANPCVSLCFYWGEIARQIRLTGRAKLVRHAEADAYFETRPRESQIAAWASMQSNILSDRTTFEERLRDTTVRFYGQTIPRPSFWSGYKVEPNSFEFWRSQEFRTHERLLFTKTRSDWTRHLLYP